MKEAIIISAHGIGDNILAFSCASFLEEHDCKVLVSAREEVFNAVEYLFGAKFSLEKIDESISEDNAILKDPTVRDNLWSKYKREYKNLYYVVPDLLFNSPLAFDYKKYRVSPQVIKSTRLLLDDRKEDGGVIYLGLNSTTEGYTYKYIASLAVKLAKELPNFKIYLPIVTKWANKAIDTPGFAEIPANLIIEKDPNFRESLDILAKSSYFVGTDNGPSHIAYHYGIPRLILDPQFGRLPWIARWKEDYAESIPIQTEDDDIVKIVSVNVGIPQTTLIPRMEVLRRPFANWPQELFFKF